MNLSQKMNLAHRILSALFPSYRTQKQGSERVVLNSPPVNEQEFIKALPTKLKNLLNIDSVQEINLDGKTYFTIYDMEDGNYLAADMDRKVYSLVHDARPVVLPMDMTLLQILMQINNDEFDVEEHLNNRYYL